MKIGVKSAQDFVALLIRRKWWVIVPFVALSCIITILVQQLPRIYVSESLVLVRPRDVPENFVMDLISGTAQQRLRSIEQTVMSRNNIVAILSDFKGKLPEFSLLNMDAAVERMRSQIHIKFDFVPDARGNNTITSFKIQYEHKNPAVAKDIASKLTTLFIEQDSRTRETHVFGTTEFLKAELDKKQIEMQESDERLKTLKDSYQPELPQQLEANLRGLDRTSDERRRNSEALEHARTTLLNLEEKIASVPEFLPEGTTVAGSTMTRPKENPLIDEYRKEKLNLDRLKASLPSGSKLPDLEMQEIRVAGLKAQIPADEFEAAINPKPSSDETTSAGEKRELNPQYQSLKSQIRTMNTEISNLQKEKALIETNYKKYAARIDATPGTELKLSEVLRDNSDIRKEYEDLNAKLTAAKLAESLESKQRGDQFMVLDPANFPIEPSKPNKWAILFAGFGICLAIGIGIAFLADVARQRVWTQSEIESFWGVPVMVDIPEIVTDGDIAVASHRRRVVALSTLAASAAYSICLYLLYLRTSYILERLDPVLQKVVYR
jgi:polysaccharide chain length determinant protein (PEP-CTERM system associated)